MNIVLDQAEEVNTKTGAKRAVGKIYSRPQTEIDLITTSLFFQCTLKMNSHLDSIGKILLKGDCITLMQRASLVEEE